MTRESIVFIVGIVLFLMPHLGIPENWKFYFYTGAGLVLIIAGYSLRRSAYVRSIENTYGERDTDSFVEHVGSRQTASTASTVISTE